MSNVLLTGVGICVASFTIGYSLSRIYDTLFAHPLDGLIEKIVYNAQDKGFHTFLLDRRISTLEEADYLRDRLRENNIGLLGLDDTHGPCTVLTICVDRLPGDLPSSH